MGLDVARGSLEADRALVEGAVDANVSKFSALKAGFVGSEMVMGEGGVVVSAGPPNFDVF